MAKKSDGEKSSQSSFEKEKIKSASMDTAKSIPKDYKSTADIEISKILIDQILGQESAVQIIKKAAEQRRNVLLIGEPGTGKSMLGLALAELLPKEKLADIITFPNPNDENTPLVRTVPAGQGRELIARARIQGTNMFKNQNIVLFIFVLLGFFAPWWAWAYYLKYGSIVAAIMTGTSLLVSMLVLIGVMLSMMMGRRIEVRVKIPKIIVDNFKKKQAPFYDATGAHAGALLGDVLHDPFQTFFPTVNITLSDGKKISIKEKIDTIINENKNKVLRKKESNYEAINLPKNELLVLGEIQDSIYPVEVLSCNRYDYIGEMIKLTTSENKELIVTPEHKIACWKPTKIKDLVNNKIAYVRAKDIKEGDEIFSKAEDIIIDEQEVINTYDKRQQEQCRLYYQFGKTRWWHAKKHIPVPVQTANWLKERGLLPLKIDNQKLPLIAKVLGATFGDGGIFENLNGIFLSSSEKEAVEEFGGDLEKIFNLNSKENSRIIEGGIYGHSWCYQNTNRNLIRLFLALGAPKGNKTNLKLKIPGWIKLNKDCENEFYQALGKWALLKKNKYNELIQRGYGAEHAMQILNLTPNSLYLLLNNFGPNLGATT